jgi:hypothetical protein
MSRVPRSLKELLGTAEYLRIRAEEPNNNNTIPRPHDPTTEDEASITAPNCRTCKEPLVYGADTQKKDDKFLVNCRSCRDAASAKRRKRKTSNRSYQFSIPGGGSSSKKRKVAPPPPKDPTPPPSDPECTICAETFSTKDLTSLSECMHEPDVCHECFLSWLTQQMETTAWDRIACPSTACSRTLTHNDVKANASADVFTRYDLAA